MEEKHLLHEPGAVGGDDGTLEEGRAPTEETLRSLDVPQIEIGKVCRVRFGGGREGGRRKGEKLSQFITNMARCERGSGEWNGWGGRRGRGWGEVGWGGGMLVQCKSELKMELCSRAPTVKVVI
jgi:hypothetical protein